MNILQDKDGNISSMRAMFMSIVSPIMAKYSVELLRAEGVIDMPLNMVVLLIFVFLAKAVQSYFESKGFGMEKLEQFKRGHAKDIKTAKRIIAAAKNG